MLCVVLAAACSGGGDDAPAPAQDAAPVAAETAATATGRDSAPATATAAPELPPVPAHASDTSDAGTRALARASGAYETLDALRADFTMELNNPLLRRTTTSRGRLAQRAPDRILLRFTEPDGDVIVGDGTYFWVFYPSVSPDQVTRAPAAQAGSGGVDLRAQFVGEPAERFDWTLEGTENVAGRPAHVLTLVPKEPAGYRSLRVWIDDEDGLVRRFRIEEHNGSMRTFELSSVEKNPTLPDSLFRFEPPEGVRIVAPPRTN
jgi:outer membrane lipoprotein carrier protein